MIKVSDNKHTNFPVVCGEDYEQFFKNELMYYLYSDIWKKKYSDLCQDMKMKVSPGDTEHLKTYLRKKREEVRIKFTQTEAYTVWNHCYDAEQHDYSIPKFLRKLNTLYDGEINRAEWNRFMSYHCQTKYIDTVLAQLLENEKQTQDGIVNFQYNNYGEIHFGCTSSGTHISQDDDNASWEPLRNLIFDTRLFDTNERLIALRNTIASAIDLGDASVLYGGTPLEVRIDPHMLSDWYYIVKSLEEAKAIKGKATDTGFIDQMASWFPTLFVCESPDEFSKHKRSITKAISNERGKWKNLKNGETIKLNEMWAKEKQIKIDRAKKERIYELANKGLLRNLTDLKQRIEKEKSNL